MALRDLVAAVRDREKSLVVFAPPSASGVVDEVRDTFTLQNLAVEHVPVDSDAELRAELTDGDAVLGTVDGDDLLSLVAPDQQTAVAATASVLDHVDETTFTYYDRGQMIRATREVEDRAWRVGRGTLHAGFQFCSTFADQSEVYRRLGGTALSVHVYGAPDVEPPEGPFTVHVSRDADVTDVWFVAFDGDGEDAQKCALVAQQEEDDRYYGFLTYDPALVDDVLANCPADDAATA
jgi:DICT domain-containing protein